MNAILDFLLPIVRKVAESAAGTEAEADVLTDVRNLEALAASHEQEAADWLAQHAAAADEKVAGWLVERLQRYLPVAPVPADPAA